MPRHFSSTGDSNTPLAQGMPGQLVDILPDQPVELACRAGEPQLLGCRGCPVGTALSGFGVLGFRV